MGLYVNNSGILSPVAGTPLETLTGLQEQINKQGAKNMAPPPVKTTVVNGVTFTVNEDGSITGDGTKISASVSTQLAGQNFIAYSSGLVKLTGGYSADFHVYPWDLTRAARPYTDETKTTLAGANQYDSNGELTFYIEKGNSYTVVTRLQNADSVDNKTTYPMVRWAGDLDPTYEPYCMSNRELTTYKTKSKRLVLPSTSINAGANATIFIPSDSFPDDFHELLSIVPVSVGPTTWSSSLPALFSNTSSTDKYVVIRAYATGSYAPVIDIIYI